MNLRKIPVALLTYNRADTAIKSIESLLEDVNIKDIAVFDDGSNHQEISKLESFCSNYSIIKIYKNKKNFGYPHNLKRALSYLTGLQDELVFLCESDMLLVKNWSTFVFEAFDNSPDSIALSVMLHQDQLTKNRSQIFKERCLTGSNPYNPSAKKIPFGDKCYEEMPDKQAYVKLSKNIIKYVTNSVGTIIFRKEYLISRIYG